MTLKTSVHIKPCNIGQSEAHNERTKEYLAHINASKIYIRQDLTADNQSWKSELQGNMFLQQYYDAIGKMVKEKTGRAMQTKERERVNKKTGKVIKIGGCSPLREGVIVCKEDTTMEQLHHFADLCHERFGITALQIHLHKDEGHYTDPNDKKSWKPNYHAHIVWDWMNHENGRSYKLNADDISAIQDLAAEALEMERGESKAETGAQHLERNDYIVVKQKAELEAAKSQTEQLAKEKEAKDQQIADLNQQIKEKKEKADRENGNAILQGGAAIANAIAKKMGKGKYAALEKENEALKRRVPEHLKQLQASYEDYVAKKVEEATAPYKLENEQLKQQVAEAKERIARQNEHFKDMQSMYLSSKLDLQHENSQLRDQLEQMKSNLAAFFNLLGDKTRQAISAIREFAYDGCFTRFTFKQASIVNNYLLAYPNRRMGANTLILLSRPFITEQGYEKSKPEIRNVANDFGWYERIEQVRIAEEERKKAEEARQKAEKELEKHMAELACERECQEKQRLQKPKRVAPKRTVIEQNRPRRGMRR